MQADKKLREFYQSPLGQVYCWYLKRKLKKILKFAELTHPPEKAITIGEVEHLGGCFGKDPIPHFTLNGRGMKGMSALVKPDFLPSRDAELQTIIASHVFEKPENIEFLTSETYRILEPEGKLYIVISNKNSFWADKTTDENTITKDEILISLLQQKFVLNRVYRTVYFPPTENPKLTKPLNFMCRLIAKDKCGVYIIEAQKKVFAQRGRPLKITPSLKEIIIGKLKPISNALDLLKFR